MTDRWVGFLRAINTGNRRVEGPVLVGIFESLGFEDVSTYQASGNVLFSAESPATEAIEQALNAGLGYDVPVALRSAQAVREMASARPFSQDELDATEGRVQVVLLRDAASPETLDHVLSKAPPEDLLRTGGSAVFWLPRAGISGSALDLGAVERAVGAVTVRTQNTVRRLVNRL